MRRHAMLMFAVMSFSIGGFAQGHEQMSAFRPSPEFEQMKKLVGKWEGTAAGKPTLTEFKLTASGSTIMEILGEGTPFEMVTMYHMDGDRLLATHYCGARNQPRMQAVAGGDGKTIQFKYVDGTNIAPGDTHMEDVKFTLADLDHHQELWTSTSAGKPDEMLFDLHRVK